MDRKQREKGAQGFRMARLALALSMLGSELVGCTLPNIHRNRAPQPDLRAFPFTANERYWTSSEYLDAETAFTK